MTPTQSIGTKLSWNGHNVAKLTKINGLGASLSTIDVTTHDSEGGYDEFIPGKFSTDDVAIEGLFDPGDTTGQLAMMADFNAKTLRTAIIIFPAATGTTWTFSGYITAIKVEDAGTDGVIPFTATIKPTGKPTFAVATVVGMSAVTISDSVLTMPAFDIAKYEYVVTITHGTASCTFTPVDATSGEVITITANGASQTVATGAASTAITLSATAMTDVTVTISATDKASKTYKFHLAVLAA